MTQIHHIIKVGQPNQPHQGLRPRYHHTIKIGQRTPPKFGSPNHCIIHVGQHPLNTESPNPLHQYRTTFSTHNQPPRPPSPQIICFREMGRPPPYKSPTRFPPPNLPGQPHLEIPPLVDAAALLQGHTGAAIKEEPIVTLTPLEALPAARGRHGEAGTGEVTGAGAELVVAVGWTGEGWKRGRKWGIFYGEPNLDDGRPPV